MAGADSVGSGSVEKLEDVIVRSAEQVAGQVRAAKAAIATVIFGQDRVIENTRSECQIPTPLGSNVC